MDDSRRARPWPVQTCDSALDDTTPHSNKLMVDVAADAEPVEINFRYFVSGLSSDEIEQSAASVRLPTESRFGSFTPISCSKKTSTISLFSGQTRLRRACSDHASHKDGQSLPVRRRCATRATERPAACRSLRRERGVLLRAKSVRNRCPANADGSGAEAKFEEVRLPQLKETIARRPGRIRTALRSDRQGRRPPQATIPCDLTPSGQARSAGESRAPPPGSTWSTALNGSKMLPTNGGLSDGYASQVERRARHPS